MRLGEVRRKHILYVFVDKLTDTVNVNNNF
jgi:hypothetical protein